jgi:hypothetical protein
MVTSTYLTVAVIKNLQIYSIINSEQVNELQVERNNLLEKSIEQKIGRTQKKLNLLTSI